MKTVEQRARLIDASINVFIGALVTAGFIAAMLGFLWMVIPMFDMCR